MHVISRKKLADFAERYPDARAALDAWYRVAKRADWQSIQDVKQTFGSADLLPNRDGNLPLICFDIRGNHYRLLVLAKFTSDSETQSTLYIHQILTHSEYDAWCDAQR